MLHATTFPPAPRPRLVSLLDLDPELGEGLSPQRLAAARSAIGVRVHTARRGEALPPAGASALLIVSGAVAREVAIEDIVSTELLGVGDLIVPDGAPDTGLLGEEVRIQVLADARIAEIGRAVGAFPEIGYALLERLARQGERVATLKAIAQLNSVERRVLALFRHLAERWGRVTAHGIVVPLTISHRLLGEIVGARRPTISMAVGALGRAGSLARQDDGTWVLTAEPPSALEHTPRPVPHRRRLVAVDADGHVPDDLTALRAENARLRELVTRMMRERHGD